MRNTYRVVDDGSFTEKLRTNSITSAKNEAKKYQLGRVEVYLPREGCWCDINEA